MPRIEWKPQYSVGVASLDEQHRQLLALLNDLYERVRGSAGEPRVAEALARLAELAARHFVDEERALKRFGYEALRAHQAEHDSFAARLGDLRLELEGRRAESSAALLNWLRSWFVHHIVARDREYSRALVSGGAR